VALFCVCVCVMSLSVTAASTLSLTVGVLAIVFMCLFGSLADRCWRHEGRSLSTRRFGFTRSTGERKTPKRPEWSGFLQPSTLLTMQSSSRSRAKEEEEEEEQGQTFARLELPPWVVVVVLAESATAAAL
jgi:hypothetical protein